MTDVIPFGARLRTAMNHFGPLCAGIDPHSALLAQWDLPDSIEGLTRFAAVATEAFAGEVACVKPQSAFFERFGAAGIAVLERVIADLREAGTLCLLDVKRGDIGSTMQAYAQAYLDDGPLSVDAITLSPYLGYGSLRPALDLAAERGRGVFVLALTSNPEGPQVQHARVTSDSVASAGDSVAAAVVAAVGEDNAESSAAGRLGSVGMVVGATVGSAVSRLGLDLVAANAPLLAPGVGAQGGTLADVRSVFGAAAGNVLAASSRDVLQAGPNVSALRARARQVAAELAAGLGDATDPPPHDTQGKDTRR